MATECSVCCEPYNKTTHLKIACEHACEFEACKSCVRKYILGTTADPNCMQCNKALSDKFLNKYLNSTFMRKEYKQHRTELLVQQQISRLPETMAAAERQKQEDDLKKVLSELKVQRSQANKELRELNYTCSHESKSKEEREMYIKKIERATETSLLLKANYRQSLNNLHIHRAGGHVSGEEKKEARKFIMPCGNTDCRGYLSTQYKCELCEHHTCAKCFEHIGPVKEEGTHECKPENIESAEFIKKQSKPCPCCGTRISKIDGCDQMWCTQCHKAFSWNTGKIVTGPVHNPHFYQYQREHGGVPRNIGDIPCGGLPDMLDVRNKFARATDIGSKNNQELYVTLLNIHRLQVHFRYTYIGDLRRDILENQDYEKERVQYILKQISREELASTVYKKDSDRKKKVAISHVCDLFTTVGADMFRRIVTCEKTDAEFATELTHQIAEYDNLRLYVNEQLKEISMTYGICVQQINPNWTNDSLKFNAKGEMDKYIVKREKIRQERKDKVAAQQQLAREEQHRLALKREEAKRLAAVTL